MRTFELSIRVSIVVHNTILLSEALVVGDIGLSLLLLACTAKGGKVLGRYIPFASRRLLWHPHIFEFLADRLKRFHMS